MDFENSGCSGAGGNHLPAAGRLEAHWKEKTRPERINSIKAAIWNGQSVAVVKRD